MPETTHLHLRAARDRVIDLLGLGETYPLQDPAIDDTRLKVPFEQTGQIPIDPGQSDADYTLHGLDELPVAGTAAVRGTGEVTSLTTASIVADVTYKVLATKVGSGRQAWLRETATVKVGLDTTLAARILAPLFDPLIETPADTDVRIAFYGALVAVEIDDAQEGVDYRLVRDPGAGETVISEADVRGLGPGNSIQLLVSAVTEDTEISIRATKTFDPASGLETQTTLIETVLPLAVRANPDAGVSTLPSPAVIGFGQGAAIAVAGSQASAEYRLFARTLADADFVYGAAGGDLVTVAVAGEPDVQVPAPPELGKVPAGYTELGAWQPGNGGELQLPIAALTDDALVIVQARKTHGTAGTSVVQLARAALIVVGPDPSVDLAMAIPVAAASMSGQVTVSGGRPGVFYTLRRGATGADRLPPAYFHQLDAANPADNKGVGRLRIEGDFALARDPETPPQGPLAEARPPTPRLEIGSITTLDIELHVRAMKARTRAAVPLDRVAAVPKPPAIRFEADPVAAGTPARILVEASVVGDRYEPFLDGVSVDQALDGNGGNLLFATGPVNETTTFEVRITRPDDPGLPVTRIVRLTVGVV